MLDFSSGCLGAVQMPRCLFITTDVPIHARHCKFLGRNKIMSNFGLNSCSLILAWHVFTCLSVFPFG